MADFVRGSPRIRAWPRRRGRGGTKAQRENRDKFMNAQRATKYFSPAMYQWFMKQVEGSPLLPRDMMTMMIYNRLYVFDLDDGRSLWPMPSIYDVSESLDVIAKQPGQTLVRGPDHWIPVSAPGPSLSTRWTVLHDADIGSPVANVDVTGIGGWNDLLFMVKNIPTSSAGQRQLHLSVDNGASFYTSAGDYLRWNADGGSTADPSAVFHSGNTTNPRNGVISITGNNSGVPPLIKLETLNGITERFEGSLSGINAARISNKTGGNLTGGRITILGR